MSPPKIGFVTCVHPFYDLPAVSDRRQRAIQGLREAGCEVLEAGTPRTSSDGAAVAAGFRESGIDLAVLFFCTWVSEDVTLALARELGGIPLMLWALPYLDLQIPMPSPMSGLTASASNIRRTGKRFAHLICEVTGAALDRVARAARAAAAVGALQRARFGLIGDACPGMLDVEADEEAISSALGSTTVHLPLESLLDAVPGGAGLPACPSWPECRQGQAGSPAPLVADAAARLTAAAGGATVGDKALEDNLRLYVALKELLREHKLDGYCVRCWPELRDHRRITPCAAHALLAEDGIPSTCEVDLPALIGTFILNRLAGTPAFSFDITGYLEDEGAVQFAHCGAAAPSLAADRSAVQLRSHMRTGTGLTVEFPFRQGAVTLAKLLRPGAGPPHALRLFVAEAAVIPSDGVRGSVATVRPEPSVKHFMDRWMREGVEHHIALVYGCWRRELELFCEFTGVEYVSP